MLTFSTGHGGTFLDRTRQLLKQYGRNRRFAGADFAAADASRAALGRPLDGARVLDLGCGQRFPAVLLFHTWRARATGIDTDVVDPRFSPASYVRMIRANGVERFLKTLARHVLFDAEYYRELRRHAGRALRFSGLDLRLADARAMPFADGEFDLVHSNAVFEHLADVPKVLDEIARVLKPDGVASIGVHLFPSPSGGHNLEWAFPDDFPSARVPPWDHLRAHRFPGHAYLNRWRARDFVAAFEKRFRILGREVRREGERLLTPELERELKDWTREDLLTRELHVVLKPRVTSH